MSSARTVIRLLSTIAFVVTLAPLLIGAGSCQQQKPVRFTILHTNDIHSAFRANKSDNPFHLGGLARLKTLVDEIRATKPNTLLFDGGDWSEQNVNFTLDAGSNMLRLMDAIGYNAVVVGNHDFINGPSELASTVERAGPSFPVLAANRNLDAVPDRERVDRLVPPYRILTVGSGDTKLRVAVIGLITDEYTYYDYFKPGIITSPPEVASALTQKIVREKLADVIVILNHNGTDKSVYWAKTIPYVNVIVGAHSHTKLPKPVTVTNAGAPAYVVETGWSGMFLGDLELEYDRASGRVTMKNYTLHPVTSDIPENGKINSLIADNERALVNRYGRDIFNDIVAENHDSVPHTDFQESPLVNIAADAYRLAANTSAAMEFTSLMGYGIEAGPLRVVDVFNIMPHIYHPIPGLSFPEFGTTWTIKKISITGLDLKFILDALLFLNTPSSTSGMVGTSGLEVTYSHTHDPVPVETVKILDPTTGQMSPVDNETRYSVAMTDGLLLTARILKEKLGWNFDLDHLTDTGIEGWRAIESMLAEKKDVYASDFTSGKRYRTIESDLSLRPERVKVEPVAGTPDYVVRVQIANDGLADSMAGRNVKALRSAANDPVNDRTPGNERIAIGTPAAIPAITAGASLWVEIPWTSPAPGTYAIALSIDGKDGNPLDKFTRVYATVVNNAPRK